MFWQRCFVTDLDDTARPKFQAGVPHPRSPQVLAEELRYLRQAGYAIVAATGASRRSALITEQQLGSFDVIAHSHCAEALVRWGRTSARFLLVPRTEVIALQHVLPLLRRIKHRHFGVMTDRRTCCTMYFRCPTCFWAARHEIEAAVEGHSELRFTFNPSDYGISVMPVSTSKELLVRLLHDVFGCEIVGAAGDTKPDLPLLTAASETAIITKGYEHAPAENSLLDSLHTTTAHWHVAQGAHGYGLARALKDVRQKLGILAS